MPQQRFRVDCVLAYRALEPTTFVFNIAGARTRRQHVVRERLVIDPALHCEEHVDPATGNRLHRLLAPDIVFTLTYEAVIDRFEPTKRPTRGAGPGPDRLPLDLMRFLYPSRYCQSDQFYGLAQREFGALGSGDEQVAAICDWIHHNIEYLSGSTNEGTSALDTAISRCGVCRDFSHLAIALCRALNIPARFVSGYAWGLPQPDFHAAFEAWLGDRWYMFDPTRQAAPENFLRIGTGRDAADVSFAFIIGRFSMELMTVACEPLVRACRPPAAEPAMTHVSRSTGWTK